jgi:hypothetical protein
MSDFPKGGDLEATRTWLDKEGFTDAFTGWKADALLGLEKADILAAVPNDGLKLWGLLNTARNQTQGKFSILCFQSLFLSCYFYSLIYFNCGFSR